MTFCNCGLQRKDLNYAIFSELRKKLHKISLERERKEINASSWWFFWVLLSFYEHTQNQGKRISESDLNPESIHEKLLLNSEQQIPMQETWFCKNRALFPTAFYTVRQNLYLCISEGWRSPCQDKLFNEIVAFSLPGLWPNRMNIVSIEINAFELCSVWLSRN